MAGGGRGLGQAAEARPAWQHEESESSIVAWLSRKMKKEQSR